MQGLAADAKAAGHITLALALSQAIEHRQVSRRLAPQALGRLVQLLLMQRLICRCRQAISQMEPFVAGIDRTIQAVHLGGHQRRLQVFELTLIQLQVVGELALTEAGGSEMGLELELMQPCREANAAISGLDLPPNRLANPPTGVGGKGIAQRRVKLLHRTDQSDRACLKQIGKLQR